MKLIDYLRGLDRNLNSFIICINENCEIFHQLRQGKFDLNTIEEPTFFRSYADCILSSAGATAMLKDVEMISSIDLSEKESAEKVFMVTVRYDDDYRFAKQKLTELLN